SIIKRNPAINGLRIEKGSLYIFTDTSGYTNAYLLKRNEGLKSSATSLQSSDKTNELKLIVLKDVRVMLLDKRKAKLYDIVINSLRTKLYDNINTTNFSINANMLVHNLAFNENNGSFLKEKKFTGDFDLTYNKKDNQLRFDSINFKLADHRFNLSGRFDLGSASSNPKFSVRLHTKNILYPFAKSLLTTKINKALSIVDLDKKIDASVNISGQLNSGDPLLLVTWKATNTHLTTPFFDFDNASFTGLYTNEVLKDKPRRDTNSKVVINNFSASWHGLPVSSSSIEINNLSHSLLTCDLESDFPLTVLNNIMGSNAVQLQSGSGSVNLTYKGPLQRNTNTNSFINGFISFKNGNVLYTPRNVALKNVNGNLVFKNSDVIIKNLQCVVLGNKIVMDGEAKNLLTLINAEPNKANIDWNIYSPALNLSSFIYLLQPAKSAAGKAAHKRSGNTMAANIDDVLEQGSLHVNLHAARLLYKKFEATNAIANVSLPDRYIINNVSMEHAGGSISLNGSVLLQKDNDHLVTANVIIENADVNKVFSAFNNFGQDGIKAQNLEGKLFAKVNASIELNDDGKANPNTIKSVVDFSLKKGALNDFEPVKKIQSFIFKKRDFDNIRFAELKDKLEIANQEIKINRMEIESTVLSMYVEGVFSMNGATDMSIQIPLSNLKKRDDDYIPENKGLNRKAGKSIFLRGRPGSDGNIQFKLDLFNKFKKDKDDDQE
ncbi:MAG: DUF3971 domain-containing protein, partial [Bacteroidota bacterium]|nr:DUF3971 domain-containing protein [Bacteroidota bacterium]